MTEAEHPEKPALPSQEAAAADSAAAGTSASPSPQSVPAEPAPAASAHESRHKKAERYKSAWQAKKTTGKPKERPGSSHAPTDQAAPIIPVRSREDLVPHLRDLDAEIEGELQAMLGGFDAQSLNAGQGERSRAGSTTESSGTRKAMVISVRRTDVFLQVPGQRSEGCMPLSQFPQGPPAVGTEVEVTVEGFDAENGLLILARQGSAVQADWSTVASGMIVEARVTGTNKGGLSVDVNGIRGFMPISQIDLYRVETPEQFVNQRLRCLVVEVNLETRNLVVSRRALQEKEREEAREKLWAVLAEGQIYEGVVRSVKDFGAFVDLGGVDGLLHVGDMSWARVGNAADVVKPGEKLKVVVLRLDRDRRKVSLGLKQLVASPWEDIHLRLPEGSVAKGKVTRLAEFGAFVELEPGIEGLIHRSELAAQHVRRVSDVVQVEQEVQVRVLAIDRASQRISLSLKGAIAEVEDEADEEQAPPEPPRTRTTPLRGGIGR